MDLEIKIDENLKEPKITISAPTITDEIKRITEVLKNSLAINNKLNVFKDSNMYILPLEDIETIYSSNNKIYVRNTNNELYTTKQKLYELEEFLKNTSFVRISNSEIVNFDEVEKLNLKTLGTIILIFKSKNETYVSRRFIKFVKDYLKI